MCRLSIKNSTPEDHRAMTWATWSSTSKIDSSREEGKLLLENHLNARKRNSYTQRKAQNDSSLGQDFARSDCNLKEGAYREAKVHWRTAPKSSRGNKSLEKMQDEDKLLVSNAITSKIPPPAQLMKIKWITSKSWSKNNLTAMTNNSQKNR